MKMKTFLVKFKETSEGKVVRAETDEQVLALIKDDEDCKNLDLEVVEEIEAMDLFDEATYPSPEEILAQQLSGYEYV